MNFKDYYINSTYDGYLRDYMYLESFMYCDPFEKSELYWSYGNGGYLEYTGEYGVYWNEALIFNI